MTNNKSNLEGVPDLLNPQVLDRLAELVVAKLTANNGGHLLYTQGVRGSSPLPPTTTIDKSTLTNILAH
ncbi:hypothetical protein ACFLXU_07375 [Chloroflexota bacterium]